ncbi:hypothetical protein HWV62_19071 [Athelia sp. TMB]|nr:hypothetical protein HWV62_19071 [Athelia sp. TMB]
MSYQHYQQVAGSSVPRYSSGSPVPHHRPSHSRHTSDAAGAYAPALYGATSDPQQFFPTPAQTVQSHYANPGLRPAPLSSPSPLNPRHPPPAAHTAHYLPATPPPHVPASQSYPHLHASGSHDAGPASPPPVGDRYVCTQCGASFSRSHDRKRHWASQHATSPSLHRCRLAACPALAEIDVRLTESARKIVRSVRGWWTCPRRTTQLTRDLAGGEIDWGSSLEGCHKAGPLDPIAALGRYRNPHQREARDCAEEAQ